VSRAEQARDFIARAGWSDGVVKPLAGDASNRRYDRVARANGSTAVLMDAPPDKGETVQPFLDIAAFLTSIGLSAPRIYHADTDTGFLLIEDLGDRLFAREIEARPEMEDPLYRAAIDVLTQLHRAPPPPLSRYDADTTVPLAALAYDWYQFGATGEVDTAAKTRFSEAFRRVIAPFDPALTVLIQRDYHAENLLWLPDRKATARVGLLDFQSAMLGHPAYDLVSILQDARRDVPKALEEQMIDRFLRQSDHDRAAFTAAYAVFGAQRNLRILGVFARLCLRDGKAHYVDLIPRVWAHIETNLRHPALSDIAPLILTGLPRPDRSLLDRLKSKCGTCAGR
jgi:aminoglycoside/choline kinase family phosphotransferase